MYKVESNRDPGNSACYLFADTVNEYLTHWNLKRNGVNVGVVWKADANLIDTGAVPVP